MSASASAASSSAGSLFGVDPSVEQLAGSFDALGAHQFFSGNMKLAYNNVQGRYVVAAQDLPAGTLVLDQAPFAGVLFDDYVSVFCHQCFGKCMGTVYQCSDCKFARYCSRACHTAAEPVHKLECASLKALPLIRLGGETASFRCVMRALYLGHKEEQYLAAAAKAGDANAAVTKTTTTRVVNGKKVTTVTTSAIPAALQQWKPKVGCNFADVEALMTHEASFPPAVFAQATQVMSSLGMIMAPEVWKATGAVRAARLYLRYHVNAHSITDLNNNAIGMGIFSAASYLNHSCLPTCSYTFGGAGGSGGCNMTMRTVRAVKAGEELTHNYVDLYAPSWVRRGQLRGRYFFDPTAEGRHAPAAQAAEDKVIAGVKCLRCGKGQLDYPEKARARAGPQRKNHHLTADGENSDAANVHKDEDNKDKKDVADPEAAKPEAAAAAETANPEAEAEVVAAAEPVTDATLLTCAACGDRSVTVGAVDALVESVQTRLHEGLALYAHGKNEAARAVLEGDVVSMTTLPAYINTSSNSSGSDVAVIKTAPRGSDGAPCKTVAGLVPFHYVVFNAYTALVQLARAARDFKAVGKWATMALMALKQVGMADYPAAANAQAAVGDADAVAGGVPEVVVNEGRADAATLAACTGAGAARTPESERKRKSAAEAWRKAAAVYVNCYGDKSPLTIAMKAKVTAMDKIIAAWV